jgi:hypothetical protein
MNTEYATEHRIHNKNTEYKTRTQNTQQNTEYTTEHRMVLYLQSLCIYFHCICFYTVHFLPNWLHAYSSAHNLHDGGLVEGKAIPLQSWTGPWCSWRLRLPDFKTIST